MEHGAVGILPCGCWAAASFEPNGPEMLQWLQCGYTVRPLQPNEPVKATYCAAHDPLVRVVDVDALPELVKNVTLTMPLMAWQAIQPLPPAISSLITEERVTPAMDRIRKITKSGVVLPGTEIPGP
jgi:hypothetical protein